jgi:hypothetical protein
LIAGHNGETFSEVMFLFTLRSFGGFNFSRTFGIVPLLFGKSMTHFSKMAVGVKIKYLDGIALSPFLIQ